MENILHSLLAFQQTTMFAAALPYLRVAFALAVVFAMSVVIAPEDVLADVRAALRHADVTPKAFTCNKGVVSEKLTGKRPLTLQTLAPLPVEFWQWFAVQLAARVGVPQTVAAGARLARRQARMSLSHNNQREGVA